MNLREFYARHNSRYGIRLVVTLLFLIFSTAYFFWRTTVFNPEAWVFSIIFFVAELFGFIITLFTLFITWRVKERRTITPEPDLKVDVFIPTYNESVDIVRLTALAAKNIRYPHDTWILDDGNRSEIKALAEELGCNYLARKDNKHAKAGNLNNALEHSKADFIAMFDADHIPEENFLDRLLGYFNDPKVAYVQSPQDFYNIDSFQFNNNPKRRLLWHDQTFFYQVGQAGRDYWNATSFCGTTSVIRRSALDAIGGFATETVTEDMHTAVKLQKLGYKTVYHPESLTYGVAATTYVEFLQQRLRWGHGNVQTLREEGLPFCKGLTIPQKICYTALGLGYFEGITRLILYLTPAIVLLTGIAPIGDTRLFFHFFIPYFLFAWLCIEECGRGNSRFFTSEYMAMARFPVYLLSCMGLFLRRKHWRITSKERVNEIPVHYIVPQLLVLILNITAFVVGVISPPEILILSMSGGTIAVICFWALLNIILAGCVIFSVMTTHTTGKDYQFHLPIHVSINRNGLSESCLIDNLSVVEMTFIGVLKSIPSQGELVNCRFSMQELEFSVQAEIISVQKKYGYPEVIVSCVLNWPDANKRDQFNLKLHHCSWHRAFTWNGGFFKTPLEKITSILNYVLWPRKISE